MNNEEIITNLTIQGAQIKALQVHQERLAHRLDIYCKSMDASVPRTTSSSDGGNYTTPLWDALKAMSGFISKANAVSQPIPRYQRGTSQDGFVSERMPVTPGWNGRQVADWTRFVAEEPKTNGWYDTFGDKGQFKKWWGGDIWYDSDNQETEDPFAGKVFFWRMIPSSLKMKVSLNDTSPEFHAFLKETKTTFFPTGANTELHVNGVELFFLASAWGQQQYIKAHPLVAHKAVEKPIKSYDVAAAFSDVLKKDRAIYKAIQFDIANSIVNEWKEKKPALYIDKLLELSYGAADRFLREFTKSPTGPYGTEITSSVVKGFDLADDKKNGNGQPEPLKARYSAENDQPGITYYPYETFIGIKKDGKSFFTLQAGKWFKDSERPVPFQLRTIQGEKVLCEDYPSGLGWACKTEDLVNAALAGRLKLINPPQQERKYRYFVTMPWGEKVPDYDGKMPPFTAPTVKLKPGQVWQGNRFSYEIRGFNSKTLILRVRGSDYPNSLIEMGLVEFREAIQKGLYKLQP